ncbi:hypothetical protein AVEN_105716-1 [Araneus ventricosus]|uniref:Transposase Tc1-like domain-containing protein n=1 Tax=Araneus ventricosus TaxID=182803 RepID=A0A4Y2HHL9_ARAVE|nr:hypothetical protein AVEN_105716-1 [Araneus ventricosus]
MKRNPAVTPQRLKKWLAGHMLQFASSDSSGEYEIAKAESMSRRNHLRDEIRWRTGGMLPDSARQFAVARELLQRARRRRTLTARQLASKLSAAAGRPISGQTVSRRLYEGGLFAQRPVVYVPLSPAHVSAQLHWPVNIAVGHQSIWATYSLRMSLDLTPITIPEGQ